MAGKHHEHNAVRRYLLKQLSDAEEQEIELRLLRDDSFFEELEIVEDELIDEYLLNELSRDERKRAEQDFLTNPERQSKLKSAQAMKRYLNSIALDTPPSPGRFKQLLKALTQSPIPAAVTFLFIAVIGLAVWRAVFYKSNLDKGLIALNEAYRQQRPINARVTALDHAPFENTRGTEPGRVNSLERTNAQLYLSEAVKERPNAASYHALGQLYLLQREPDKAIEYLDQAAKADTTRPQIYADLGAAYMEKANQESDASKSEPADAGGGKGLEDLGRSLEYLKRALDLNPNLLEALFNRALVHQQQGLIQQAETDWRVYLEKDSDSQGAVEALQNLNKLLEDKKNRRSQTDADPLETFMRAYQAGDDMVAWEIYRRSHTQAGNLVTKALVDRFLANAGNKVASESLQALNYLGQLENRNNEDAYTSDLAKVYSSATPQTQVLLIQARQQVAKGRELLVQSQIGEATEFFASARSTFEKVGDLPESLAADRAMARGAAAQPDLARGQKLLARIVPACESRRYKWLLADALTARAHIQSNLNNYSEAISDGERALHLFQELQDVSSTLDNFVQLATLHLFLNDVERSFSFLRRAMAIAQEDGAAPIQLWRIQIAVSLNLSALKLYRATFDYQYEALQIALSSGKPLYLSRSYQYIGLTYGSLQQFDLALENIRKAYEQGRPLAAEPNGQNMMANASLRLGDLYRLSGDETDALAAYEESSRLFEELKFGHYSYAAHKGKFLTYLAQNNDAMASQELLIVMRLFDEYREKILDERQKSFFFDKEQDTCDLVIDFAYYRIGDQHRAFDYSETCRARNLHKLMRRGAEVISTASGLDLRSSEAGRSDAGLPLTATEIQQQLPEQVQLVEYAVLEKKLLVWHVTRSSISTKLVEIESSSLTEAVANALRQIRQRDESGAANSLKNLYNLLIEPIKGQLDPSKAICFVPDKILHYVPFGALISMSSGHYLVQDYRVMISPSASILIDSTNKARAQTSVTDERLLAVGNPTFSRKANPELSNLPDAEREVEEISSSYPAHRVLVQRKATRKSVADELPHAQVAHFAAHYEIDSRSTLSSRLLLSVETGESAPSKGSGLNAGDIYQMNLTRTRLVILAACQTGIEQQFGGEGPIGFARSFLVAGVPVVVASLWPVDSEATSELMIAFHRFRKREHLSTSAALMRAQQEIMARENYRSPYYWAGFTVIGGYSDF